MEYLVFDSTRRNRNDNPNPADFRVFTESASNMGVPAGLSFAGVTGPSSTLAVIEMPTNKRIGVADYYAAWTIQVGPQTRAAVSYDSVANTISLDAPFVGISVVGAQFRMLGRSGVDVLDAVIGAIPYDAGVTTGAALGTTIPLGAGANPQNNFYINSVLEIGGEYRTVVLYEGGTQTATVNAAYTVPVAAQPWLTRYDRPQTTGTLVAASSTKAVSLAANTPIGLLNNDNSTHYLRMTSGAALGQIAQIQGYTSSPSHVVGLGGGITNLPAAADTYEILGLTRDNVRTLHYRGSWAAQSQASCYAVSLIHLSLPNKVVFSSIGGLITDYSYVVVQLESSDSSTTGSLYANSSAFGASGISFIVPIDDSTNNTTFVRLRNIDITQNVKFTPTRNSFKITIKLPGGEVLRYAPDTVSPLPPDPLLQIAASFSFTQISG